MVDGKCKMCGKEGKVLITGLCTRCASSEAQIKAARQMEYIDDGEETGLEYTEEEIEELMRPTREKFYKKYNLTELVAYRKAHGKKY